ncbi:hypothetical protein PRZ48_004762 [Zasmidium cellare]|uniref:Cellobiose dehydrogenase cytochrome domain-containing protein n=1 Tax=Zasmidium cellare TaxID=395010 RepID=A0ABR0EQN4_ZASCE|nr:hypothetical protein PRZ48_004762 [Zasmidium cellare]
MGLLKTATLALASTTLTNALLCVPDLTGLLGIGTGKDTLNGTFILQARSASGTLLPIVNSAFPAEGGFFLPLYLGNSTTDLDAFTTPLFTLQSGSAYANGGTRLATMTNPLLKAQALYLGADSSQFSHMFEAVNATCDGKASTLLRFQGIVPIPLATASINQTSFAPGAGISSPILEDLLTTGIPVDLVITPHTAS